MTELEEFANFPEQLSIECQASLLATLLLLTSACTVSLVSYGGLGTLHARCKNDWPSLTFTVIAVSTLHFGSFSARPHHPERGRVC